MLDRALVSTPPGNDGEQTLNRGNGGFGACRPVRGTSLTNPKLLPVILRLEAPSPLGEEAGVIRIGWRTCPLVGARFNAPFALLMGLALTPLGGCTYEQEGPPDAHFEKFDAKPPKLDKVTVCHAYGCKEQTAVHLHASRHRRDLRADGAGAAQR